MKKVLLILLAVAVVLTSANAMAATATNALTSTVAVAGTCSISSVTNLDFVTYDTTSAINDDDGAGDVTFICTKGTAYDVYITGSRTMTNGTDNLNFEMYQDAGRATLWPASAPGVTGTAASNSAITRNIYGRIPALQDVGAGTYNGTVTVTVVY